jgi:hypothetical protein
LDRQALVACWRESLLAQAVLAGRTRGYTHHPQLDRFRGDDGLALIGAYLSELALEADHRGYRFDRTRILHPGVSPRLLTVTSGQLSYEWRHLLAKMETRSPDRWAEWNHSVPEPHPLFRVIPGPVEHWEKGQGTPSN